MHRLAHAVVAAERERKVRNAPGDAHAGAATLDLACAFDEGLGVRGVLLDARRDGQDVGVEDDVLRPVPRFLSQQAVRARADVDLALDGVGLALLVEGHHDSRGSELAHPARFLEECLLALLEADRVAYALALQALEARFEHGPLRAVDHDRNARDLRLGRDEVQELDHRRFRVEEVGVHVHVQQVGAAAHLVERDLNGPGEVARLDEAAESL